MYHLDMLQGDPVLTTFDDMPSDIDVAPVRAAAAAAILHTQPCWKCRGSGVYRAPSSYGNQCFKCGGSGKLSFKTSPEQRAKAKQQSLARAERKAVSSWDEFKIANKPEAEWIEQRREAFGFAGAMYEAVRKYGKLTDGQMAAVRRCVVSDQDRAEKRAAAEAERAQIAATAPAVDDAPLAKIEAAFAAAKGAGIRYPKLRLDRFVFSPAPASGKNAGAIYVKQECRAVGEVYEGAYLGKIAGGRFQRVRECDEEKAAAIVAAASDPEAAAVAYGKRYGLCAVCSRDLTNAESIERGIGPVCAKRMGW